VASIASRLIDMAGSAFLSGAEVTDVSRPGEHFVGVELRSPAFRSAKWSPGTKVQIRPERGSAALRTYTPIYWDADEGRTGLLAFVHGDGPADTWFGQVGAGARIELTGPRRSLDGPAPGERIVFVGDESSVALACAFHRAGADAAYLFEASDPGALPATLAGLGTAPDAVVVGRPAQPDRAALLDRLRELTAAEAGAYRLVVTGDAATVLAVRRGVRNFPRPPAKVTGKAYWAAGRRGLD